MYLYNLMLQQSLYPSVLKVTKVVPIYKKGDRSNPSSYRPISLVPLFSKIFESCIKKQLCEYFVQRGILCQEQFGFLPGKNTIQAIELLVENVLTNFENRSMTSATLIDLSKAFDCISHELLINKFNYYGVQNNELELLSSYLRDRKQMVVQGNNKSEFKYVHVGVPQGSNLGPFLFLVAVNDLPCNLPCKSILYADDTTLLNNNRCFNELTVQQDLAMKKATEWFRVNCLSVNNDKTENIVFSLDFNVYSNFKSVKLLGIQLDSRLSWEGHINHLCTRLARVVFLLRKLKLCVSTDMLINSYYAFFHSLMLYGITLWGNSHTSQKIFVWQKKALRVIKGVNSRDSCLPIFKELNINTLPGLYIYCCVVSIKENLHTYKKRENVHNYHTRYKNNLDTAYSRLEQTNASHVKMKIKLYNKLPETARYVTTNRFKTVLSAWLKQKVFYSIDQFMNCDISDLIF
jgi:hypothetical protein